MIITNRQESVIFGIILFGIIISNMKVMVIECESNSDKNENLSVKEYLNKIKPYLRDMIIDLQKSDTWKVQLAIAIAFVSSKNIDEEHVMHSKSNNIEFMTSIMQIMLLMKFSSHFFQDTKVV